MRQESNRERNGMRWWDWALIIVGPPIVALLLWLWLRRRTEEEAAPVVRIDITPRSRPPMRGVPVAEPASPAPDDLRRIEGIGPRISSAFQAAGITTFAQVASTAVERLRDVLREAGIRANPSTWPEQAGLAAAGEWDTLKALQAELKGGRRA